VYQRRLVNPRARIVRVARRLDVDDNTTYIIVDVRKAKKLLSSGVWVVKLFRVSNRDIEKLVEMQSRDSYVVIY
jgi:hypothetical protein